MPCCCHRCKRSWPGDPRWAGPRASSTSPDDHGHQRRGYVRPSTAMCPLADGRSCRPSSSCPLVQGLVFPWRKFTKTFLNSCVWITTDFAELHIFCLKLPLLCKNTTTQVEYSFELVLSVCFFTKI